MFDRLALARRRLLARLACRNIGRRFFFLHWTPELGGGVVTFVRLFTEMFPEHPHLILCHRGARNKPALQLKKKPGVYLLEHLSHKEAAAIANVFSQRFLILNHAYWDSIPLTRSDIAHKNVTVFSILHSNDAQLRCEPSAVDRILVFSRYFREIYIHLAPETDVELVPLAIDTTRLATVGPTVPNGSLVVGNMTNGAPWKHADDFLELCFDIRKAVPGSKFVFLGARDLAERVAGLPDFQIIAPFGMDIDGYLRRIHVLLHKTGSDFSETWCFAVTEALAAGIPVVAEAKGGIQDQIVSGVNGFLCRDNEEYVRACRELANDPTRYTEISRNARETAQSRFDLAGLRKRFQEIFCSVNPDLAL
jgi:glycosyltransferase involved in cell wall biosynthesis